MYDADGNRTSYRAPIRGVDDTVTSTFDAEDRVLSSGSESLTFTPDGTISSRTSSGETTSYAYTPLGELSRVTRSDGHVVTYAYDAHGQRVSKSRDGVVTERYEWAGPSRLLAVYDGSRNLLARFVYADDRVPYEMLSAGATYTLACDQAGTLALVADATGNAVKRVERDSFGNLLEDSNPGFRAYLGFAGGLEDADAGVTLFGARNYDSGLGRWLERDPAGFGGGDVNLYAYCGGDPADQVDLSGSEAFTLTALAIYLAVTAILAVVTWFFYMALMEKYVVQLEDMRKELALMRADAWARGCETGNYELYDYLTEQDYQIYLYQKDIGAKMAEKGIRIGPILKFR